MISATQRIKMVVHLSHLPRHRLVAILVPIAVCVGLIVLIIILYFTVFEHTHGGNPFPVPPEPLPPIPSPVPPTPSTPPSFDPPDFRALSDITVPGLIHGTSKTMVFDVSDLNDYLVFVTRWYSDENTFHPVLYVMQASGESYQFQGKDEAVAEHMGDDKTVVHFAHRVRTMSDGSAGTFAVALRSKDQATKYQGRMAVYNWNGGVGTLDPFTHIKSFQNPNVPHDEDEFGRMFHLVRSVNHKTLLYVSMARRGPHDPYPEIREYLVKDDASDVTLKSIISRGSSVSTNWGQDFVVFPERSQMLVSNPDADNGVGAFELWTNGETTGWVRMRTGGLHYPGTKPMAPPNKFGPYILSGVGGTILIIGSPDDGKTDTRSQGSLCLYTSKTTDKGMEWDFVQQVFGSAANTGWGNGLELLSDGRMVGIGSETSAEGAWLFRVDQDKKLMDHPTQFKLTFGGNDPMNIRVVYTSSYNRIRFFAGSQSTDVSTIKVWESYAFKDQ